MKQLFTLAVIVGVAAFLWHLHQGDEMLREQRELPAELSHWRKEVDSDKYDRIECKDDWWRATVAGDAKVGEAEDNFVGSTKILINLLNHKPGGAALTDDEAALLQNCEASLARVKQIDKDDEKQERRNLDEEQASEERRDSPSSEPSPTPKGDWMWRGSGNPLDHGAYNSQ